MEIPLCDGTKWRRDICAVLSAVSGIDGRIVSSCKPVADTFRIPVESGVYLVTVNGVTTKIVVK